MKHQLILILSIALCGGSISQTNDARLKEAKKEYSKGNSKKALEITSQVLKDAEKNSKVSTDELFVIKSENAAYLAFTDAYDKSMKVFDALVADAASVKP